MSVKPTGQLRVRHLQSSSYLFSFKVWSSHQAGQLKGTVLTYRDGLAEPAVISHHYSFPRPQANWETDISVLHWSISFSGYKRTAHLKKYYKQEWIDTESWKLNLCLFLLFLTSVQTSMQSKSIRCWVCFMIHVSFLITLVIAHSVSSVIAKYTFETFKSHI